MSALSTTSNPQTLPELLAHQAYIRPRAVALRHKRLGIWQEWTWRELLTQTRHYATSLARRGLNAGDSLLILSQPRVEALVLALAVQSLDGQIIAIDPDLPEEELNALLRSIDPGFVFAEGQAQVEQVIASGSNAELILFAEARGLGSLITEQTLPALLSLEALLSTPGAQPILEPRAHHPAFVFHRLDSEGTLVQQVYTHQRLIDEARTLIELEHLQAHEEALAARAFATVGQARYLLTPWLVAGFRLNFPENLATRDNDRRELSPTLVLGTQETYGRVANLAEQKLPVPGSLTRRIYDWSLRYADSKRSTASAHPWAPAKPLAWLIRRSVRLTLRESLGFGRLRTALLVGEALPAAHEVFYQTLGITLRRWPDTIGWQRFERKQVKPSGRARASLGAQVSY